MYEFYIFSDFPTKYKQLWKERWLRTELLLRSQNRFICRNFEIYSEPLEIAADVPILITKTENCKCFHKLDRKFRLPHGIINIKFISSVTKRSVANINMTTIFTMCVKHLLLEKLYPAKVVGYKYKITSIDSGLIVLLSGFNEKLPILLDEIIRCMLNVGQTITKSMFEAFRKNLRKHHFNNLMNSYQLNELVDCSLQKYCKINNVTIFSGTAGCISSNRIINFNSIDFEISTKFRLKISKSSSNAS